MIIGIVVSFNFFQATNGLPLNSSEGELVNNIETSNKLNRQKRDFDLNPNKIDETALYIGKNSIFFFISYLYIYYFNNYYFFKYFRNCYSGDPFGIFDILHN